MPEADPGEDLSVTTLSRERPFEGRIVALRVDTLRLPSGRETVREVVEHTAAVAVVAVDADARVTLLRHYRHPAGQALLELPAGLREPGEEASACARRELLEETGLEAGALAHLCGCYPSPGISTELIDLFLARDVRPAAHPAGADADEEVLELVRLPLAEAVEMAASGGIADAKTIVGLLLAERRLGG